MKPVNRKEPSGAAGCESTSGGGAKCERVGKHMPHIGHVDDEAVWWLDEPPKPDRWKDNTDIMNLVAAAEDTLVLLDNAVTYDHHDRCECRNCAKVARLRAALKGME